MLIVLLFVTVVLMVVSMTMAVVLIRAEEKSRFGRLWIALSCFSVVTAVGIGFLMITAPTVTVEPPVETVGSGVSPGPAEQEADVLNGASKVATDAGSDKSRPVTGTYRAATEISKLAMDNSEPAPAQPQTTVSSEDLLEILDTLKRGEPIPDHYLQLLPEEERQKLPTTR